ncbi:hypothetical protein P7C70_g5296, partial [Phenoliferia sp. Uapishka_3]
MTDHLDIKFTLGDTTRRLPLAQSPSPTWAALKSTLQERFNLPATQDLTITYIDEEGDHITLSSDAELKEAWEVDAFSGELRSVTVNQVNATKSDNAALIEKLKAAVAVDPSFAHELLEAVRGDRYERGFHHFGFGGRGGRRGGWHNHGPGRGHHGFGVWEMRPSAEDTSSSSDEDEELKVREPTDGEARKENCSSLPDSPRGSATRSLADSIHISDRKHKDCKGRPHKSHAHHGPPPLENWGHFPIPPRHHGFEHHPFHFHGPPPPHSSGPHPNPHPPPP